MKNLKKVKFIFISLILIALLLLLTNDIKNIRNSERSFGNGKDTELTLAVNITEINPNSGIAKVNFQLFKEFNFKNSDTLNKQEYKIKKTDSVTTFSLLMFNHAAIYNGDDDQTILPILKQNYRKASMFLEFNNFNTKENHINRYNEYDEKSIDLSFYSQLRGYFFPFDKYFSSVSFQLIGDDKLNYYPNIEIINNDNKFIMSFIKDKEKSNGFIIHLYRPTYVLINFILISLIALLIVSWSFYRIVFSRYVSPLEIIALNITLILSFPTLRPILVPDNINFSVLYDLFALLIWILSIIILITYFNKERHLKENAI